MDENKGMRMSKYIFGGGVLLQFIFFTSLSVLKEIGLIFYFISCGLMVYGLYLNLKAKGLSPFKKLWFYLTALLLFWPLLGLLVAMGIMLGTPVLGAPVPRWKAVLFSPWTIALTICLILGLIAYPQFYAFRAKVAQIDFKEAKRHLAIARAIGKSEDVRRELDEATARLAAARRSALTDANTGWFIRYSLGDRLIKESELAELAAAIEAAKAAGSGKIK